MVIRVLTGKVGDGYCVQTINSNETPFMLIMQSPQELQQLAAMAQGGGNVYACGPQGISKEELEKWVNGGSSLVKAAPAIPNLKL